MLRHFPAPGSACPADRPGGGGGGGLGCPESAPAAPAQVPSWQGVSVCARQPNSRLPIPGLGIGECSPRTTAGGVQKRMQGEGKDVDSRGEIKQGELPVPAGGQARKAPCQHGRQHPSAARPRAGAWEAAGAGQMGGLMAVCLGCPSLPCLSLCSVQARMGRGPILESKDDNRPGPHPSTQ